MFPGQVERDYLSCSVYSGVRASRADYRNLVPADLCQRCLDFGLDAGFAFAEALKALVICAVVGQDSAVTYCCPACLRRLHAAQDDDDDSVSVLSAGGVSRRGLRTRPRIFRAAPATPEAAPPA